jgi:hypothetical protein
MESEGGGINQLVQVFVIIVSHTPERAAAVAVAVISIDMRDARTNNTQPWVVPRAVAVGLCLVR